MPDPTIGEYIELTLEKDDVLTIKNWDELKNYFTK